MSTDAMTKKIKSMLKSPTLIGTFFVTLGVFVGSIFSYLLQIGLGNLLTIEDFGLFNAFLSLLTIFSIPAGAISVALIKKVSELLAKNDLATLHKLFWSFSKISLVFGLFLSALFVALNNAVSSYLKVTQPSLIFVFSGVLALSFINTAPLSYLQGLLRFKAYAFIALASQFLRLIIPMGLVYAGYRVAGAYGGFIIVSLLTFLLSYLLLKKNLGARFPSVNANPVAMKVIYKSILAFSVPVLLINSGVALLNNIDIIMVKHYFDPYQAGIYAGLITMCKVFLFGASIVQTVMFPQISHLYALGADYKNRFFKFLLLQLIVIGTGLAVFVFFPSLINSLMFGGKFVESVPYIPSFALFVSLYIVITFLSMFLLAVSKTRAYLVILPACVIQYILIANFHQSLASIIKANTISAGLSCLFIAIYVVKSLKHEGFNNSAHIQTRKNHQD